jgi:hypothetical protein
VFDSAKALKGKIQECYDDGARSITLVCHSMGNHVARALLENVKWHGGAWFKSVSRYVGICGPHSGVPELLKYALGLDDWLSIRAADMQTFSRDSRYPALYQLFPFRGIEVLIDVNAGALDIYDTAVAAKLGLDRRNLRSSLKVQERLDDFSHKPKRVEYVIFAASGQWTDEKIQVDDATFSILRDDAGDGTIPLWSAAKAQFTPTVTPGDHLGVLNSYAFRNFLWNLLAGVEAPLYPTQAVGVAGLTISVDKPIYAPGETISVLVIPDQPTTDIAGTLEIETADFYANAFHPFRGLASEPFAYQGLPIRSIRAEAKAPVEPGLYRMSFSGRTHATAPQTAATFGVSANRRPR